MTDTPFERFIELVQVDQKINALYQSILSLEQQNAHSKQKDEVNYAELEKVKNKLAQMRKEVESKELEMKILDQQEAEKKQRLESVANHKEYQPIKAEIDQLKKSQHELEDGLMAAWNHLETVKKEHEAALGNYEKQHQEVEDQIAKNNEKIAQIKREVSQLLQEREHQEKTVPAEWLEKYAIMRAKITNPVVPVIDGICSACFYKVSAQDMQFLKHRRLVQCKDCFRLLYLPEAQDAAATQKQDVS